MGLALQVLTACTHPLGQQGVHLDGVASTAVGMHTALFLRAPFSASLLTPADVHKLSTSGPVGSGGLQHGVQVGLFRLHRTHAL